MKHKEMQGLNISVQMRFLTYFPGEPKFYMFTKSIIDQFNSIFASSQTVLVILKKKTVQNS